MNNASLINYLKNDCLDFLEIQLKEGALVSEIELQCLLYNQLRILYPKMFVYPEMRYGKNYGDLVVCNKPNREIKKGGNDKKVIESIIELKYGFRVKSLSHNLAGDMVALINDGAHQNRLLLYILDRSSIKDKKDIKKGIEILKRTELISQAKDHSYFKDSNFNEEHLESIHIIGYLWDGENLELIKN